MDCKYCIEKLLTVLVGTVHLNSIFRTAVGVGAVSRRGSGSAKMIYLLISTLAPRNIVLEQPLLTRLHHTLAWIGPKMP
jgi:hypothetical protein